MNLHKHWRNKQLGSTTSLLWQETLCWDFMERHPGLDWRWHGQQGNFFKQCSERFEISKTGQGVVIINYPVRVTPKKFIDMINILIHKNPPAVYLAINRYEFIPDALDCDWADEIVDCLDQIVDRFKYKFTRLTPRDMDVGGFNFVGVHGLDIFTYENHQ